MSTQPRPSAKVAAKRRAATRRRNREMIRRILALFFVFVFVLGTATTIFIFQQQPATTTTTTTTSNNVAAATVPPAGNSTAPTAGPGTPQTVDVSAILKQGDDAATAGKWDDAITYYKSALGLTTGNATIHYDLGKAYIEKKDYTQAVDQLQQAVTLNPQAAFAGDAQKLIDTYKSQVTPGAGSGSSGGSTSPITSTAPITK